MTAEISVFNKLGVALAADSAATTSRGKVFNSANKIFTLDSAHLVGIMIYGNANFMDVPWEVIIKTFREKLGQNILLNLEDYENAFIEHVKTFKVDSSTEMQILLNIYSELMSVIQDRLDRENYEIGAVSDENLNSYFLTILQDIDLNQTYFDEIDGLSVRDVEDVFGNDLRLKISEQINSRLLPSIQQISELTIKLFFSKTYSNMSTGIVIAGYGKEDIYPKVSRFSVDGAICGKIKITNTQRENGKDESSILPFAQQEMVHTVLRCIDPGLEEYRTNLHQDIKDKVKQSVGDPSLDVTMEEIFFDANRLFVEKIQEQHIRPVVEMLSNLSLSELASMAETLVSLTSFKRKYSGDIETVGGPIDVLVISRSDGPIWIKRKKYFDIEMNEGFVNRRKNGL